MSQPRDYDSTIARMAGNIVAGLVVVWDEPLRDCSPGVEEALVSQAVRMAYAIVAETKRVREEGPQP